MRPGRKRFWSAPGGLLFYNLRNRQIIGSVVLSQKACDRLRKKNQIGDLYSFRASKFPDVNLFNVVGVDIHHSVLGLSDCYAVKVEEETVAGRRKTRKETYRLCMTIYDAIECAEEQRAHHKADTKTGQSSSL